MRGVRQIKTSGSWISAIKIDGTIYHIGAYSTKEAADAAMKEFRDDWFGEDMWWPFDSPPSTHPLYCAWEKMRYRCNSHKSTAFKNYGGRGITVCKRWDKSFYAFIKDVGVRPSKDLSLDRINNDLGYSKENCRWATRTEQAANRRISILNKTGCSGVYFSRGKYRVTITRNKKKLHLGSFEKKSDAVKRRKEYELKHIPKDAKNNL